MKSFNNLGKSIESMAKDTLGKSKSFVTNVTAIGRPPPDLVELNTLAKSLNLSVVNDNDSTININLSTITKDPKSSCVSNIRRVGYAKRFWTVNARNVPMVTGNETPFSTVDTRMQLHSNNKLETISLIDYLNENFNFKLKSDFKVRMNSQCCFVEKFITNGRNYNNNNNKVAFGINCKYQSSDDVDDKRKQLPPRLVITSCDKGTSFKIVNNDDDSELMFNFHGVPAYFVHNGKPNEKNSILIVEIPLLLSETSRDVGININISKDSNDDENDDVKTDGMGDDVDNNGSGGGTSGNGINDTDGNEDDKSATMSTIKINNGDHDEKREVKCLCGAKLDKYVLKNDSNSKNNEESKSSGQNKANNYQPRFICVMCLATINKILYLCPNKNEVFHHKTNGYALCQNCYMLQTQKYNNNMQNYNGNDSECTNFNLPVPITRDETQPIKVTYLFTIVQEQQKQKQSNISNSNETTVSATKQLLHGKSSIKLMNEKRKKSMELISQTTKSICNTRDFMQSLFTQTNRYLNIRDCLKQINVSDDEWSSYYTNFRKENVTDKELSLLNQKELSDLIPKIGPRKRFFTKFCQEQTQKGKDGTAVQTAGRVVANVAEQAIIHGIKTL